jgi:prepilin-type N-terminal cleavage/methylation domain-containing protein
MKTCRSIAENRRRQGFSEGFTLLEILVAMVMVALVTLILMMAFRLTLQAWERASTEGESRQMLSALPTLLENQLNARATANLFASAQIKPDSYFCGSRDTLSFLTMYAPQGSAVQGLLWVRYQFDSAQGILRIYLQPVTRLDDLGDSRDAAKGISQSDDGYLVSELHDIVDFSLAYTDTALYNPDDSKQWYSDWKCGTDSAGAPFGMMLTITIKKGSRTQDYRWIYQVRTPGQMISPFGFGGIK